MVPYSSKSKARKALLTLLDSENGGLFDVSCAPHGDAEWLNIIKDGLDAIQRQRRAVLKVEANLKRARRTLEPKSTKWSYLVETKNFSSRYWAPSISSKDSLEAARALARATPCYRYRIVRVSQTGRRQFVEIE